MSGTGPILSTPRETAGMVALRVDGCFGWLHTAGVDAPTSGLAAVLCPPLGREARWTHRTVRKLADRLAEAGVPSLRFDFPGMGDSREIAAGEDPLAVWQASLHAVVDAVRTRTGAHRVVLVGLRLGALLAAEIATRRDDVAALALLAPVVSGRTYVRELKAAARVARHAEPPTGGGIEFEGMSLSDAALLALGELSLTTVAERLGPIAKPLLLLDPGHQAVACVTALRSAGVAVAHGDFEGYAALMGSATSNRVPYSMIGRVLQWVADDIPLRAGCAVVPACRRPHSDAAAEWDGCREQPLRFGPGGALFGMLCRPAAGAMPKMAVLIFNTGGDPHYGIGRLGVMVARRLADEGIASLRMDFAGLGDSISGLDEDAVHLFETDRKPDIDAAVTLLAGLGVERFGATGLCAGAYHAFHAAVRDSRFVSVAPINMTSFAWRLGDSVEEVNLNSRRSTQFYREGLWHGKNWRRLLKRQVRLGGILRALALRVGRRVASMGLAAAERVAPAVVLPTPRRMVRALSKRGTRMMLVASFEDTSLDALEEHFGPAGRALAHMPGMDVEIVRDADHNLSTARMRRTVTDLLVRHFALSAGPVRYEGQAFTTMASGAMKAEGASQCPIASRHPGDAARQAETA